MPTNAATMGPRFAVLGCFFETWLTAAPIRSGAASAAAVAATSVTAASATRTR